MWQTEAEKYWSQRKRNRILMVIKKNMWLILGGIVLQFFVLVWWMQSGESTNDPVPEIVPKVREQDLEPEKFSHHCFQECQRDKNLCEDACSRWKSPLEAAEGCRSGCINSPYSLSCKRGCSKERPRDCQPYCKEAKDLCPQICSTFNEGSMERRGCLTGCSRPIDRSCAIACSKPNGDKFEFKRQP